MSCPHDGTSQNSPYEGGRRAKALRVSKVSRKTPTGVLELAPTGLAFDSGECEALGSLQLVAEPFPLANDWEIPTARGVLAAVSLGTK